MPVADANIIVFGSSVMPTTDVTTQIGGAIDLAKRLVFTDIDPTGLVEQVSDGADTRNHTIDFLTAAGVLTAETKALNGAVAVDFVGSMSAILRMLLASPDAARTVTLRKDGAGATLATFPPDCVDIRRPFFNAIANAAGGATKYYYEKVFFKNLEATLSLTGALVSKPADPEGVIDFALESILNGTTDNGAGNNRLVAPAGFSFDSITKNVANSGVLTAGATQGVWLRLKLDGGKNPADVTFTLRLAGTSA